MPEILKKSIKFLFLLDVSKSSLSKVYKNNGGVEASSNTLTTKKKDQ